MGDRVNIKIKEENGNNIYVYSHWDGLRFFEMLKDALELSKDRWDDPSYFQRVLITELCKKAEGLTGYGVSSERQDNEHDVMEVDVEEQKVRLLSGEGWFDDEWRPEVLNEWTFEEYIKT